jgi:hypothetical protein
LACGQPRNIIALLSAGTAKNQGLGRHGELGSRIDVGTKPVVANRPSISPHVYFFWNTNLPAGQYWSHCQKSIHLKFA